LDDHCFRAIKETRPELLLTDDIVDSIILRSLGFASVPIVGLSKINEYGLNLLDRLFAVERFSNDLDLDGPCTSRTPSPSELAEAQRVYPPDQWWVLPGPNELINQDEDHVRISIVTWSLRALSLAEPVAIRTALQYLRELEAFCDLPIYEIQQWSPTSHQMASLQFALKQRNFGWAKKAVRESLVSSSDGLPSARRNNPPPDLTTALEEVQQAFACEANSGFWPRCKSALAAYQLAIQRVVLGPLVGQTQGITDPMERAMHAQLADLYCLFTNAMFPMRERMFAGLQPYPSSTQTDDGKALSNSLAISKQILTLTSQILQCRHHKPRPRPTQRTTSGSPPWSFAGSDSAMMN